MTDPTLAAQIEALAPCPFCGLEWQGHFQWPGGAWSRYTVPDRHHKGCPLRGESYATEADLIAAWNTRPAIVPALRQAEAAPGVVEEVARLKYYPDYVDDADGLARFRQAVLANPGHDMAAVNHNSLGRLIDTIERLRRERDDALARQHGARER